MMKESKYSGITREDIIRAIDIYNNSDSKVKIKNYVLVYEGKEYPSKEIIRIAYNLKNNSNITSNDFSGGKQWISFYEDRGFEIKVINKETDKNITQQNVKNETAWDRLLKSREEIDCKKLIKEVTSNKDENNNREPIKVGCYLQTPNLINANYLNSASLDILKNIECDIIVFPEFTEYNQFKFKANKSDIFDSSSLNELYDIVFSLSQKLNKAIMICNHDKNGVIFSIYANYNAIENETKKKVYVKCSFDKTSLIFKKNNFSQYLSYLFEFDLINYKGYKIGMTICADCNARLYSAMYKKVDIILNGTGGFVNYKKWYIHNKARALENNSFTFTTMGRNSTKKEKGNNYTFGFDRNGIILTSKDYILAPDKGGLYVYEAKSLSYSQNTEKFLNLSNNTSYNYVLDLNIYNKLKKLKSFLYGMIYEDINNKVIICEVYSENIYNNKFFMELIYESSKFMKLKKDKTIIVVNKWDHLLQDSINNIKLSLISFSMNSNCATILTSHNYNICMQPANKNKDIVFKNIMNSKAYLNLDFAKFNMFKTNKVLENISELINKMEE